MVTRKTTFVAENPNGNHGHGRTSIQGGERNHGIWGRLLLLITLAPVAHCRTRFTFDEKLGRNPQFKFDGGVGGIAIPALRYTGLVERGRTDPGQPW